jgi:hypothetical protein
MTGHDVEALPDRPGPAADADEWTLHHRLFYRLVAGAPGIRTADLQLLYDVVAPVAYEGTTASPTSSRRWRRKLLGDLQDAGVIDAHPTPRGWVWPPTEAVVATEDVPAVQGPPTTAGGEPS